MFRNRERTSRAIVDVALVALALVVGAAVLVLAVAHVDDRFGVDHVSGTWLSLAAAAREGTLYPPLAADGFFAGTRYVPLPFLLQAVGDVVTGDPLRGGKLVSYAAGAVILALVLLAARRRRAPWPVALVLTAAVPVSVAGVTTMLWIRGDAVAVALGLGSLAVVAERPTVRRAVIGGLLAALAWLSMLTALWAVAGLVGWLALRHRRAALAAAGAFLGASALLFAAGELLSRGRMSDNVDLLFAGAGTDRNVFAGVRSLWDVAVRDQRSVWALLVVAAATVVVAVVRRRPGVYELALVAAGAMLLVVMRDVGAAANHLLPATALAAIVVAGLWSPELSLGRWATAARAVAVVAAVAAILVASRHTLAPDVRDVLQGDDAQYDRRPLAGLVSSDDCLLAQDPTLPLLLGRRPVVLDPFMLLRLGERRPEDVAQLVQRIDRGAFDRIVLFVRPERDPFHFRLINFGGDVADAIERSYRFDAEVESEPPVFVYVPRARRGEACRPEPLESW